MSSNFIDWYEVLGIPDTATASDVKRAYRKMALRWHPEKNASNPMEAAKRFAEISHAYETLLDAARREAFDRERFLRRPTVRNDPRFMFRDPLTGELYRDQTPASYIPDKTKDLSRSQGHEQVVPKYRDEFEVFREFFGGREPFVEAFFNEYGVETAKNASVPHVFDQTMPGFILPGTSGGSSCGTGGYVNAGNSSALDGSNLNRNITNQSSSYSCSMNGGAAGIRSPASSGSVRHVTTSTRLHNGKKMVTKKIMDNGIETVTVEEDGKLISKTVNGHPVSLEEPVAPTSPPPTLPPSETHDLETASSNNTETHKPITPEGTEKLVTNQHPVEAKVIINTTSGSQNHNQQAGSATKATPPTILDKKNGTTSLVDKNRYGTSLARQDSSSSTSSFAQLPKSPLVRDALSPTSPLAAPAFTSTFENNNIQDPLRSFVQDPLRAYVNNLPSPTTKTAYTKQDPLTEFTKLSLTGGRAGKVDRTQ